MELRLPRSFRSGSWWSGPLLTGVSLAVFVLYSAWAVFQTGGYHVDPYVSPLYTPCLAVSCGEAMHWPLFGEWWRLSPALIVAWVPVGFRASCYYYRKVYYRAFFLDPPNCSEEAQRHEPRRAGNYRGERGLFVLQNVHRYFWMAGVLVALMLTWDAIEAFRFTNGWGVGLGSLIFAFNAGAFWLWALGCHSCRHIVGGRLKHFSKHPVRYRLWTWVSKLNARHGTFAWISLPAVIATDLYVRLIAWGALTDPRFF